MLRSCASDSYAAVVLQGFIAFGWDARESSHAVVRQEGYAVYMTAVE